MRTIELDEYYRMSAAELEDVKMDFQRICASIPNNRGSRTPGLPEDDDAFGFLSLIRQLDSGEEAALSAEAMRRVKEHGIRNKLQHLAIPGFGHSEQFCEFKELIKRAKLLLSKSPSSAVFN